MTRPELLCDVVHGYKTEDELPGDDELSLNCSELKPLLLKRTVVEWAPLQSGKWQHFTIPAPVGFAV